MCGKVKAAALTGVVNKTSFLRSKLRFAVVLAGVRHMRLVVLSVLHSCDAHGEGVFLTISKVSMTGNLDAKANSDDRSFGVIVSFCIQGMPEVNSALSCPCGHSTMQHSSRCRPVSSYFDHRTWR